MWRATFWFVGAWGFLLLVVVTFGLGETNKFRGGGSGTGFRSLLQGSGTMLRDRRFLGYVLTLSFAFAINFGMLSGRSRYTPPGR